MQAQEGIWLRTDEIEGFIGALEHSAELSRTLEHKMGNWKWLILALHNAVQGACTCALRGKDTAGVSMLTKDSAKAVWHWLDNGRRGEPYVPMPPEKLATMIDLYARVRRGKCLEDPFRLPAYQEMSADIRKLNELRNEFIHFVPKGWSLEVSGMPQIVQHCCEVIEHLAVTAPTFGHHLDCERKARIRKALSEITTMMKALHSRYGAEPI